MELYIFLTVIIKFILYLGCFFTTGTIFYRHCFQPQETVNKFAYSSNSTKLATYLFASIGLFASVLLFVIKLINLNGSLVGLFDLELIALLWQTPTGDALLLRMVGFAVILFCWEKAGSISLILLFSATFLILKSFASVGHIHNLDSVLIELLLLLHLFGLSLWVGVLIPLYQFTRNAKSPLQAQQCAEIFGYWAIKFVPVLLGAGVWLAYQLLGSWLELFNSQFGQILLFKLGFVSLLLILATLNKFYYVAKIKGEQPEAIKHFHLSIKLELALVGIIFYCTAMLTSFASLPQ